MKKNRELVRIGIFCFLLATVLVTICSQNSFLYLYNTEYDVHCFFDTGRSIFHGKVLYRDVYEHKGLYLYFFHIIAYLISSKNFIGISIIEIISGAIFLFFTFRIADLLINNRGVAYVLTAITGVWTYTCGCYAQGGFCEEYTLPFLMVALYMVVEHFVKHEKEDIKFSKVVMIGAIAGVLFWIKYSTIGLILGVVVYITIICLAEKRYKLLFQYIGMFLLGFFMASIPALLYFGINGSFKDLFQVYFYNLLVVYGDDTTSFLGNNFENLIEGTYWGTVAQNSSVFIFAFVFMLIDAPNKRTKISIISAFLGTIAFLVGGVIYNYQSLILAPFFVLGCVFVYRAVVELKNIIVKSYNYITNNDIKINYDVNVGIIFEVISKYKNLFLLIVITLVKYYSIEHNNIFSVVAYFTWCFAIYYLIKSLTNVIEVNKISKKIVKYILLLLGVIVVTRIICTLYTFITWNKARNVFLTILMVYLIQDFNLYKKYFIKAINKVMNFITKKSASGLFKKIMCMYLILYSGLIGMIISPNFELVFWGKDMFPQYEFAQYIEKASKEKNIVNPIIYSNNLCDAGVYVLLDYEPQQKHSGWYMIKTKESLSERENNLNGYADFVISSKRIKNDSLKYVCSSQAYDNAKSKDARLYLYEKKN